MPFALAMPPTGIYPLLLSDFINKTLSQKKGPSILRGRGSSNRIAEIGGLCFKIWSHTGRVGVVFFYEEMMFRGSVFHGKNQHIGKIALRC